MKKLSISGFVAPLVLLLWAGTALWQCIPQQRQMNDDQKIAAILDSLTLEEKARLLVGTGMHFELPGGSDQAIGSTAQRTERQSQARPAGKGRRPAPEGVTGTPGINTGSAAPGGGVATTPPGRGRMNPFTGSPQDSLYMAMVDKVRKYLPGAAGFTVEYPLLGVTTQVLADGPAGLRISPRRKGDDSTYFCTAFPIATLLASTWDPRLVEEVGQAMGREVLEYGADVILGPALNIQRDPLCGRNFEYYSEDPLVTGRMASAMVKGIQSNGVGTSPKHFAANNSETFRMSVNTIVSERALREIYLRGFEMMVREAQPWTIMSSYNKINGVYAPESEGLLTTVLRGDWGFEGYVMSDWGGGNDAVAMMKAGNDVLMPGTPMQVNAIVAAVEAGQLDEVILDRNITRMLKIMFKTPRYNQYPFSNKPNLGAHAKVTRQAAADGMVLLKNEAGALPLDTEVKTVAAFGNTSYDFISGGTGSGDVNEAYTVALTDGLRNGGYTPDEELMEIYTGYMEAAREKMAPPTNWLTALMGGKQPLAEMPLDAALAVRMADKADIALVTIGRNAGEGQDRTATEGDFLLTPTEKDLIRNVSEAFRAKSKKTIVILNIAGVIETASWRDLPDAILLAWQPGQEGGNSVVDILSGKVNPSGKLAATFPVNYSDCPSAINFPGIPEPGVEKEDHSADLSGFSMMKRAPWQITYEEDIYVGYRYFNTFGTPVAYEFGYGLSYTTFEISELKPESSAFTGKLKVTAEVKNIGSVAGREVVQLYLTAPAVKLEKPETVLVAFAKTKVLQPGERETITFTLTTRDIASFDEAASRWIAEAGEYTLRAGNSSRNLPLSATFTIAGEIDGGAVTKAVAPQAPFNRLTRK